MAETKKSTAKSSKPKKIVDVAHPGKTAPPPNSKSVIIGHGPMLQDPMVLADATEPPAAVAAPAAKSSSSSVKITPPSAPLLKPEKAESEEKAEAKPPEPAARIKIEPPKEETPEPIADEAKVEESKEESKATEPKKEESVPKPELPKPEAEAKTKDEPEVPGAGEKNLEAEEAAKQEAEAKRQAELQKLVDSKKFFLPINSVEKRRSKRFVALGILLSVVLIVAWADIALDAGLIKVSNIKPVTHFFST